MARLMVEPPTPRPEAGSAAALAGGPSAACPTAARWSWMAAQKGSAAAGLRYPAGSGSEASPAPGEDVLAPGGRDRVSDRNSGVVRCFGGAPAASG